MVSRVLVIAAASFVVIAQAAAAGAQAQESKDLQECGAYSFYPGEYGGVREEYTPSYVAAACARQGINHQLLVNLVSTIPYVVARSFGIGPAQVNPAGLGNLTPEEFGSRLESGSAIVISPVADAAPAAAPATRWNAWVDGKYTWNDNSPSNFDLDGPLVNGMAGIDYKLTDKITFGVLASYENSKLDGVVVDLDSQGIGAGPYLGIVLTNNIVFSANLLGSRIESSQFGGILDFESDRLQASAALTGYWYHGTWRFTPGLSLSWSKEWLEETSGFLLPDQTIESLMLTPSVQVGNTLRLSDTTTVEPWAGVSLDHVFVNETKTSGLGTVDDPYSDLRAQAGFNFSFGSNAQLAITGEIGGLLQDSLDTYSIEANLAVQF